MYFTRRLAKRLKVSAEDRYSFEAIPEMDGYWSTEEYMNKEIRDWFETMVDMKNALSFDPDKLMKLHPALFWGCDMHAKEVMKYWEARADVYKVDWIYNKLMADPNAMGVINVNR